MDDTTALPSYEDAPAYEGLARAPSYQESIQTTLAIDPTGKFIQPISKVKTDLPALYSLTSSLLKVNTRSSIQVKRLQSNYPSSTEPDETRSITVYGIGELYIGALHSRKPLLQNIIVARSHGILAATRPQERVWHFVNNAPNQSGDGMDAVRSRASDGLIGAWGQHLLKATGGEWISYMQNDGGEVVAIESRGCKESVGMPMLSLVKGLDKESMDLLVSAWCVKMWGHVNKTPSRLNILLGA